MVTTGIRDTGKFTGLKRLQTKLQIIVVHTGYRWTMFALREAAKLGSSLDARIRIFLVSVASYPLSLREPPVSESHRQLLKTIANGASVETVADTFYCRAQSDVIRALQAESLVVIGGAAKSCWPWDRMRALRRARACRTPRHLCQKRGGGTRA
jgi:hypothetical protein